MNGTNNHNSGYSSSYGNNGYGLSNYGTKPHLASNGASNSYNSNSAVAGNLESFGTQKPDHTISGSLVSGSHSGSYGNNFGTQATGSQNLNTASFGSFTNSGNHASTVGLGETSNSAASSQGNVTF